MQFPARFILSAATYLKDLNKLDKPETNSRVSKEPRYNISYFLTDPAMVLGENYMDYLEYNFSDLFWDMHRYKLCIYTYPVMITWKSP